MDWRLNVSYTDLIFVWLGWRAGDIVMCLLGWATATEIIESANSDLFAFGVVALLSWYHSERKPA